MTTAATRLMTAEEFYDWVHLPENRDRHFELDQGKVVEVARPGERHGVVCANASWVLSNYVRQRRQGYVCANDTGVIWQRDPDSVRGPDLLFYADSRPFDELNPKYSEDPPQLAVEVLSPTDRMTKVTRRISQFLDWGVALVWLIDPEERTVTVFRSDRKPSVLEETQELTGDGVLTDFRCAVADFFFSPEPAKPAAG
jgi:Uma2 family endonuclease